MIEYTVRGRPLFVTGDPFRDVLFHLMLCFSLRKKIVSRVSKLKTKKETFESQVAEFPKKIFEIICRTGKKFVSRVS